MDEVAYPCNAVGIKAEVLLVTKPVGIYAQCSGYCVLGDGTALR